MLFVFNYGETMNILTFEEQRKHYNKTLNFKRNYSYDNSLTGNDLSAIHFTLANAAYDSFMIKVSGDSMIEAGISDGDTLVVSKTKKAGNGVIVIAEINGKIAVKRLKILNNKISLVSDNKKYAPIEILDCDKFRIWGTVSMVIKEK